MNKQILGKPRTKWRLKMIPNKTKKEDKDNQTHYKAEEWIRL
jgi:hypothetical protein